MNVKQIAVAVSLAVSGVAAMAVEATQWNPPPGRLSRAEVKADLARAIANGELDDRGEAYAGYQASTPQSTLARSQVKQELARARANGELEDRNEAYGGFPQAHPQQPHRAFAWRKLHPQAKSVDKSDSE
jgi:hypothetical protein